ncbi:MAG: ATP-binding cassette domain-containing protein [Desulfobacterales bacterium]|jgi:phospholipid/cholesterol/gamma-HCH transport system ATP-binding protein
MKKAEMNALRGRFSYVFQDGALFDSMTVYQNIAMPLRGGRASLPKLEVKKRVEEKLQLFELQASHDKYPSQISGGMKRRVALAEADSLLKEVLAKAESRDSMYSEFDLTH